VCVGRTPRTDRTQKQNGLTSYLILRENTFLILLDPLFEVQSGYISQICKNDRISGEGVAKPELLAYNSHIKVFTCLY
jgi:hypothetical protein